MEKSISKTKIFGLLLFFLSVFSFSQSKNLSSDLLSAYKSNFYPEVVRLGEEILRTEKNPLALFRAAVYEGESLFRLNRPLAALSLLENHNLNADKTNPESVFFNSARCYWLGQCYFSAGDFSKAQRNFFDSAVFFKDLEKNDSQFAASSTDYYSLSILFGAKTFVACKDFANSIPLFEYVVSNGEKFSYEDYSDSSILLAQSYNLVGTKENLEKCVSFVGELENADFDDDTKYSLVILKGTALENLGEYKKSYETYCVAIKNAPPALAATAMQKAYAVSSEHREKVQSEAGEVLLQANDRLHQYPSLLSEFWTRLAIDAFDAKDYQKSLSYFKEASENATLSQKEIAALYKAEIAYSTSEDKNRGSKNAIEILEKSANTKSGGKNEMILINLARFNGYLKNWKECETFAQKCLQSENDEIEKNAVYWLALSKYERGDEKSAAQVIEKYAKKVTLTEKSILNLYAKCLAKLGKYHEADEIFYNLGEKNQLDNDGRLDYSRTLLIAGHYVSTKEQSAKATGDEAVYLSALASFNQKKWSEAEKGFLKLADSKSLPKEYAAFAEFYCGYAQYQMEKYSEAEETLSCFVRENPYHRFVWSAQMTSARSATFAKKDSAVLHAENAVKSAKNESEKNEAIILLAGILEDARRFDDSLAVLHEHIAKKTEFGYECKYRSAEILLQKGDFAAADTYFSELSNLTDKSGALVSENSAYRRAEIAYSQNDFAKSAELFEEYSKKWPGGRYKFAAIYFSADSLEKTGDDTRAILRYEQITDSKEESSYRYTSQKNLVALYEKTGDYSSALKMAQTMLTEYGKQAESDGIRKKISDLRAKSEKNQKSLEDKIKTAEKSLEKEKNNASSGKQNMKNAIFLAGEYRTAGENKKSAEMYLEAVKYSRIAGNDENAARSFYGAVESFDAAGLYADARATLDEMKKLYPESEYTKKAEKIAGGW